jgi:HK97 family phage prohead protease
MQVKGLTIETMDEAGTGLARIATLSAVDSDGDTYQRGAFGEQWAPILVAHNRRMVPVGKARIYEDGDAAMAELHVNLETQAGRDWHAALKFDLAKGEPVQEWSYGYDVVDADFQIRRDGRVRVLKKLNVAEVSTVVQGAGEGTRTIAIKSAELKDKHFAPLIAGLGELASALPADATAISATGLKQLGEIHAAIGATLKAAEAKEACEGCSGEFDPKDLADGLCLECAGEKSRVAIDQAIGGFLELQTRGHRVTRA